MLPDPIAAGAFVDIPGVRLAYHTAGRGAPVVFLHGGLLDRRQWDAQFVFFATNYRAIRYDMRSSGQSETTPTSQPFTHHEDLLRFLRALKISRVLLVGHSNYAVALDFTGREAGPCFTGGAWLRVSRCLGRDKVSAMMQALGRQDLSGAVEVFLNMWVDGPYRKPEEVNPLVRERVREMVTRAFPLSRLAPNCKGLEPPAASRLREVHVPTLVVLGKQDAPDIHAIGHLICEGVAGPQLVDIPDVGHTLPREKPEEFNRGVADFFRL